MPPFATLSFQSPPFSRLGVCNRDSRSQSSNYSSCSCTCSGYNYGSNSRRRVLKGSSVVLPVLSLPKPISCSTILQFRCLSFPSWASQPLSSGSILRLVSPLCPNSIGSESSAMSSLNLDTDIGIGDHGDKEEEAARDVDENVDSDPWEEVCFLDPEMLSSGSSDDFVISEWELDFCSRPILDDRGKKVWELVVCDQTLSLQYTKFFPNNVINSVTLRDAIASISDSLGLPLPDKIRFFRSQMQTIITKACNELGIKPVPSKRCISLLLWLDERYQTVYTRHPGFQQGSKPLLALDTPFPMELPENLFGDKWAFVQLPFSAVMEEASIFESRYAFGASLDLDLLGIEIEDDTLIPGLAVASSRAQPLAAWMNGLEVCSVEADTSRACLILSVGVSTRYIYASYKKSDAATLEAEAWEAAKKACGGLHFLAIQDSLDSDDCIGFWLLLDLPPPPV